MSTAGVPEPSGTEDDFYDGENLLRVVATALMRLAHGRRSGGGLYEANVQQAYDHLVLRSLRTHTEPPHSVARMIRWATEKPLSDWPLNLPPEVVPPETLLIDPETQTPSQQCGEWAISSRSAVSEVYQNTIMRGALDSARSLEAPETYTAFRRLLIERPVMTGVELIQIASEPDLDAMHHLVKRAYLRAPAAHLENNVFSTCARCHCLLVRGASEKLVCELDRCRRQGRPRIGDRLPADSDGGVFQIGRPLRTFVTGPGLAETDLEATLVDMGLTVEMWPHFDAYDLRVVFPDEQVWAIDVKDRANPALLGRSAHPLPATPPYDHGFLVIPRYRFDDREDYARVFRHHRPDNLSGRLELLADDALVERARGRLADSGQHSRSKKSSTPKSSTSKEGDGDA
ncbi:pPIWI_RE_Y domain-containing protein [Nocardiopsis nanhaiensis]